MTCSPSLHCASKRPPLLSHIFHWKIKRYSMLPIASPLLFFFFFCHTAILRCCWWIWRGEMDLILVPETSGDSGLATWQSPGLTMSLLICQKLQFDDSGRNIAEWNPRTQDVLKIISHLMKKYNSCGMLKQLVASLRGMLRGPVY